MPEKKIMYTSKDINAYFMENFLNKNEYLKRKILWKYEYILREKEQPDWAARVGIDGRCDGYTYYDLCIQKPNWDSNDTPCDLTPIKEYSFSTKEFPLKELDEIIFCCKSALEEYVNTRQNYQPVIIYYSQISKKGSFTTIYDQIQEVSVAELTKKYDINSEPLSAEEWTIYVKDISGLKTSAPQEFKDKNWTFIRLMDFISRYKYYTPAFPDFAQYLPEAMLKKLNGKAEYNTGERPMSEEQIAGWRSQVEKLKAIWNEARDGNKTQQI